VIASFEQQCAIYNSAQLFQDLEQYIVSLQRESGTYRALYSRADTLNAASDYRRRMFSADQDFLIAQAVFCQLKNDEAGREIYLSTAVHLQIVRDMLEGCQNPQNS